jgi:hypothetical protein
MRALGACGLPSIIDSPDYSRCTSILCASIARIRQGRMFMLD